MTAAGPVSPADFDRDLWATVAPLAVALEGVEAFRRHGVVVRLAEIVHTHLAELSDVRLRSLRERIDEILYDRERNR